MKLKNSLSAVLRKIHLLYWSDFFVYYIQKCKNKRRNKEFIRQNPCVVMPPDYLIYESFQLDYKKYYTDSIDTAQDLANLFRKHTGIYNVNILDWGCGPARIIRHLPSLLGNSNVFFGTDYNDRTIQWCRQNIPGVTFSVNNLEPPLDYNDQFFHIIYGISIFTHQSESLHEKWMKEIKRILAPGGIFLFTTQGDAFRGKLTPSEKMKYDSGNLVVRGNVKEGHRTFSAFQPAEYIKTLLQGFIILEFIKGDCQVRPQQDTWIVKKI